MATTEQISDFRRLVQEPDDANGFTNAVITTIINAATSLEGVYDPMLAYANGWIEKATTSVELVDITENGSSRKNSDVHKNYLAMAAYFRSLTGSPADVAADRPRTRAIVRP